MDKKLQDLEIPMLVPYSPSEFLAEIRKIIREEIKNIKPAANPANIMKTPGLTEKPLYRIAEVCLLFDVSRTTVHEWVKSGSLRKIKMRSRVYFLAADIKKLLELGP